MDPRGRLGDLEARRAPLGQRAPDDGCGSAVREQRGGEHVVVRRLRAEVQRAQLHAGDERVRAGLRTAREVGESQRGESGLASLEADQRSPDVRPQAERLHEQDVDAGREEAGTRRDDEVIDLLARRSARLRQRVDARALREERRLAAEYLHALGGAGLRRDARGSEVRGERSASLRGMSEARVARLDARVAVERAQPAAIPLVEAMHAGHEVAEIGLLEPRGRNGGADRADACAIALALPRARAHEGGFQGTHRCRRHGSCW
jgi:hypothetical protein